MPAQLVIIMFNRVIVAAACVCMAAGVRSQSSTSRACLNCALNCASIRSKPYEACVEKCKAKLDSEYGPYPGPEQCPDDRTRPEYGTNAGFSSLHCMYGKRPPQYPECDTRYPCTAWATEKDFKAAERTYDAQRANCHGNGQKNECDRSTDPAVATCESGCNIPCGIAAVGNKVDNAVSGSSSLPPPPPHRGPSPSPSPNRAPSPSPSPSPHRGPSPSPSPSPYFYGPPDDDRDDIPFYETAVTMAGDGAGDDAAEGSAMSGWSGYAMYIYIGGGFFLLLIIVLLIYLAKKKNQRPAQNQNQDYANQGYGFGQNQGNHANAMVNPFYEFDEGSYNGAQQPPARKKASTNRKVSTKKEAPPKASTKTRASTKGPKKGAVKGSVKKAKITVLLAAPFGISLGGSDKSGIKVESLKEGRNAYKSGKIHVGMKIVSVNGNSTKGLVKEEVSELIRDCKGAGKVPVVLQAR